VYGGIVLWGVVAGSMLTLIPGLRRKDWEKPARSIGLWGLGGSYILLTAFFTRTAPDARFFLPGLVVVLLPLSERFVSLRFPRVVVSLCAALALLQGGYVLKSTYQLRSISDGLKEAIEYLKVSPPEPRNLFMYPEGSYRLFTVPHEWYLGYRLREFWRGDNDMRIRMLHDYHIGAIVIKKWLISDVDEAITNLGVYPTRFVSDIRQDDRFTLAFENNDVAVYTVPK